MRPGRADVVAEELLQLILDGTFPVGGALPSESDLAGRFGVSRLTVREAIRSLVHTRVLDVQQGRSTMVNPTEKWSPLDGRLLLARSRSGGDPLLLPRRLLEARRAVEVAIVELAAVRRRETHLERMRATHEQMLDGHARGDAVATAEADLAFHAALFEAADNVFLDALFEPLSGVLRAMRQETSTVPDFRSHALDRHAAILRAVEAGDPAQAREAMEAHLQQTEDDVERYLGTAAGAAVSRS
ncbi:FadR/GntR family transcriptional regulator [Pseudonocardia sichuanensis]|uniref:DNA-binding FadR family transcriptional regulator n=1 Tax=Pseudonocardia kunmingensis TaxID=630975 RepID=A0A543DLM4_9PSEU|nr:FadR/GntR family transcriptional regulator [Pseudonocardia kunmingensis]TQM10254.1 DNA-binding FadR family transcriptional regulator [Pseudonocardia kunmingensis]